jgi:hypothetical protein
MTTVTHAFDSRAMPLSEPSTAPSAFSLWDWLGHRFASRRSAQHEADAMRDQAHQRIALEPRVAADAHEQPRSR